MPRGEPNVHRPFKRWGKCPTRTPRLLNAVKLAAFNKFVMKAFLPKGCTYVQKLAILALMDYVLEIDPSSDVSNDGDLHTTAENWRRRPRRSGVAAVTLCFS